MMKFFENRFLLLVLSMVLLISVTVLAAPMEFVIVGNAGNAPDATGYGAVGYQYRMGKYEVTNAQYAEMLNAVAASDPYGLYNPSMASWGITRSGSSGGYTYLVNSDWGNKPVNYVSWYDAARFTSWMMTGNAEGTSSTGAYDTTNFGSPYSDDPLTHNSNATYWLPTDDEWYKAAYYDPALNSGGGGYYLYPTQSNTIDTSMANYANSVGGVTDVGSYNYPSYYGTFDQGGNLWDWTEDWNPAKIDNRISRGGSFPNATHYLSSNPSVIHSDEPSYEQYHVGFRVASVPEPATLLLLGLGGLALLKRKH